MTAHFKRIITYTLSFALAGVLLFLALRGVDLDELWTALAGASYIWAIPLIVIILISHLLRAWRWQILLEALPDHQHSSELGKVSLKTAFLSVLIGYLINFLAPRLGEVVRAGNLAKQEGIRFSGVLGTVVVERIVDVIVLFFGVISLSFIFSGQFAFFQERILVPTLSLLEVISPIWVLVGLGGVCMVGYLAYRRINLSQSKGLLKIRRRLVSIVTSFKDGILTVLRAPKRVEFVLSTMLMWVCYTFMAYLPLVMLGMHTTYQLDLSSAWSLMIFGAIGMAVPSPGGTGSYHYVTKLVLVNLYMVDEASAVIYAVLNHGFHMIVYIVTGVLALLVQGVTLKSLRTSTIDLDEP